MKNATLARAFACAPACALAFVLGACASNSYQPYAGAAGSDVVTGHGGTEETVDGVELWGTGDPPHRYQVLAVTTVADFDNIFGNSRIRSTVASQVRQAGGDAAIVLDNAGDGQTVIGTQSPIGAFGTDVGVGKKKVRFEIVKYLDKAK